MKSLITLSTCLLIELLTLQSSLAQITPTGDFSPAYDGVSDPWHVGGDGDSNGFGDSDLSIGLTGVGNMNVNGGAMVTSQNGSLGSTSTGMGSATIDGAGSTWSIYDNLSVGENGAGTLTIQNGGSVSSDNFGLFSAGQNTSSTGLVSVSGAGSSLTGFDFFAIGYGGNGTLNVSNGGQVVSSAGYAGLAGSGSGSAVIDGIGSTWTNEFLFLGSSGTATLDVQNGASVTGLGILGQWDGDATVTIDGVGSTWNTSDVGVAGWGTDDGGTAVINIQNGGSLLASGTVTTWTDGSINLSGGTLQVDTLELNDASDFYFTGGVLLANSIVGTMEQDGGVFAPGDPIGLTDIQGDFFMSAGSIEFEIGGLVREAEYDAIDVDGFASLDGTMEINLVGGFTPNAGDSFQLVSAIEAYGGTPTFDLSNAVLASGLIWDTSSFLANGTIFVAAIPEPGSCTLLLIGSLFVACKRRRKQATI